MMVAQDQKRILVADDTLPMRIMLQDVLSEAGFDVIIAADGEEAWGILQEQADMIVDPLIQMIGTVSIVVGYIIGTAIEDAGRMSKP